MKLPPATLKGTYFSTRQGRFVPVGAHWVPAMTALDWTQNWDEASIEADFAKMQDLGFNTVRLDLFWAWFEPRPGDYNPEAFAQLDFLVKMAHKYRSTCTQPCLLVVRWVKPTGMCHGGMDATPMRTPRCCAWKPTTRLHSLIVTQASQPSWPGI